MSRKFYSRAGWLCVCFLVFSPVKSQYSPIPGYVPKPAQVAGIGNPVMSLDGAWSFNSAPPVSWYKKCDVRKLKWKPIEVPGEWTMQGFTVNPGERAVYYRSVSIPDSWKGNHVIMRCDGLYSEARVWVNGKWAGEHIGGFTPGEFDLTPFIKTGKKNDLVIGIASESLADTLASATQYAAHQLGGITRKIEIFAVPAVHVTRMEVNTDLDASYRNASVNFNIEIFNGQKTDANGFLIRVSLKDLRHPNKNPFTTEMPVSNLVSMRSIEVAIPMNLPDATLWDPEHPNLYQVDVELVSDRLVFEKISQRIGVREIEWAGNKLFMNGHPIKLRGLNRHEVDPLRGRSLTIEQWKADVILFKEANLNYIRTSHYPPAEEFVTLCDSVGFFVELESPHCWVGHGANAHWQNADPHSLMLYDLLRKQVLETVSYYRNHPSVLIWSMANESSWGPIWEQILEQVNRADPGRPVSFHDQAYGGYNNYGSQNCQIANIHYPGPGGPKVAWKYERPLLFGEYAHLNTYNRQEIVADPGVRDAWGRGLESMWEDMYASPGCLGGAIWSGIDDVFYLPSGIAVGYGEWGPIDGWRRKKPEYWHVKMIYSPVKVTVDWVPVPEQGREIEIPVENRHLFTDLSEVTIRWKMNGKEGVVSTQVEPRQFAIIRIDPKGPVRQGDKIDLSFISPQGFVIIEYQLNLGRPESLKTPLPVNRADPELIIQGNRAVLQWKNDQWIVDATTGKLVQATHDFNEVIAAGPELMMLPLATGPCNTEHSLEIEPLNDLCSGWQGRVSSTGADETGPFVSVQGSYEEASFEMTYHLDSSGIMHIEYTLTSKIDINPRQIGLVFDLPRNFEQLSWKRVGQWTVYPETHIGRTVGSAIPFPAGNEHDFVFGSKPSWPWEADLHPMGSNDFRATRDHLIEASLLDPAQHGVTVLSDGRDAARAWVGKDRIHMLVAGFSTAGGDMFFSSHLEKERHPLKAGDKMTTILHLKLE